MKMELKPATFYYKILSQLSILFGIVFYFGWLLLFGFDKWCDVGVYSITVVLLGFGVSGYFLYDKMEQEKDTVED